MQFSILLRKLPCVPHLLFMQYNEIILNHCNKTIDKLFLKKGSDSVYLPLKQFIVSLYSGLCRFVEFRAKITTVSEKKTYLSMTQPLPLGGAVQKTWILVRLRGVLSVTAGGQLVMN